MSRIELTADTNFYVATTGTDAAGYGNSSLTPCRTRGYLWDRLVCDYDLRGYKAVINLAAGTYTDGFIGRGSPVGLRSSLQQATSVGVSIATTQQLVFRGDTTTPANVIIKPTTGPSFMAENGAVFHVEGFKFDHASQPWEVVTGAARHSVLGLGKNIYGPSPGQHEIIAGVCGAVWIFDHYTIDHGTPLSINAAVSNGSQNMGLANPGPVVGQSIYGQYIQDGTVVQSISGCNVVMSKPATGNVGFGPYTFDTPSTYHLSMDAFSYIHYVNGYTGTPNPIQVTITGTPSYTAFSYNGGGDLVLREDPNKSATVFKGAINGPGALVIRNGYTFNTPYDNQVIFTP